jgi:hypothetical protein
MDNGGSAAGPCKEPAMWMFDITPVGAFMNAVDAANAKDRQTARHLREQPVPEQPEKRQARATAILNRARAILGVLRPSARLRTRAP